MNLTRHISHRPWPIAGPGWVMQMRWLDLLFAHWAVDPDLLRPHIPEPLRLDMRDGRAWIGVIPFRMENVRPRGMPRVPTAGVFPELNVRTYVTDGEKPGVWFFSLDASSRLAVWAARRWFGLNYQHARMKVDSCEGWVRYESFREGASFIGSYRPAGDVFHPPPGTLEHWLCERYCLYAGGGGRPLVRGEIHHAPWPLQPAEADIRENSMGAPFGLALPDEQPHLLFARRLDTIAWRPLQIVSAP